jgi:hypothetical protein
VSGSRDGVEIGCGVVGIGREGVRESYRREWGGGLREWRGGGNRSRGSGERTRGSGGGLREGVGRITRELWEVGKALVSDYGGELPKRGLRGEGKQHGVCGE